MERKEGKKIRKKNPRRKGDIEITRRIIIKEKKYTDVVILSL